MGPSTILSLPTDYVYPNKLDNKIKRISYSLNKDEKKHILKLVEETCIPIRTIMFSIYNILLAQYSGQVDFIIGAKMSSCTEKNKKSFDDSLLLLRVCPVGTQPYLNFVLGIYREILNPQENMYIQDSESIPQNHNNDIDQSLPVIFVWKSADKEIDIECQMAQEDIKEKDFPKYLTFIIEEKDGSFNIHIDYRIQVFKTYKIEQMIKHYMNILLQVSQNPLILLSQIELLSPKEKEKILLDFNATSRSFGSYHTISELFETQVNLTPEATAIVFEGKPWSYRQLNNRANQIAEYFYNMGVRQQMVVGILIHRSVDLIAALLGVLKNGAIYVPIDPKFPMKRVEYILKDSVATILLTDDESILPTSYAGKIAYVEDIQDFREEESFKFYSLIQSPSEMAYILYTSGSTGSPKGVMISHKSICNFIESLFERISFSQRNSVLCVTTVCFDIFVLETWLPLCKGLKVILANELQQVNPRSIRKLIINHKIDVIQTTPSHLKLLLDGNLDNSYLSSVSLLIGGESLPYSLLQRVQKIPARNIFNMYGPTETSVWSSVSNLSFKDEVDIGRPIFNTQIYILNENLLPVPIGVPGELYISGEGLAIGYWNNEIETTKRFIENPFKSNELMYRTGDLAKWTIDGNIEFLGRIDSQVKIRGYRIEMGEIEKKIVQHPLIEEAVVTIGEDWMGENKLYVYYVGSSNSDLSEQLNTFLRGNLPYYMVPSYYIKLEELPRTPNGKIDRLSLLSYHIPS
ncbi:MAG: non-ribosomal peptide synthetase [Bacillota bacterium]